ncbi:VOC family protein [Ensifer adhaerens]|uniref:VOC family protein n=1 Tax=Ensifer adhaerens TaxID=106592 RepID=UPI001F359495|nr:VOC family protein [Ensifer adhaerens]
MVLLFARTAGAILPPGSKSRWSAPHQAYEKAVSAGASPVKPPEEKPWGQVVGYVRDLNGCLVELCSATPA